jgi:hypothetical protein
MSRPIGREPAKVLLLLCVSVPTFMLNLGANIVAVSLPAIARSLKADFAAIESVVSAYTLRPSSSARQFFLARSSLSRNRPAITVLTGF